MGKSRESRSNIYSCSFCGKNQHQAARLIAGPRGVYICNECVALCQEILEGEHIAPPAPKHMPEQTASEQEPE